MSHLPKYKLYAKKDASTYYRSVNGIVSTTATPTVLNFAPIGWMDTMIKWVRNRKYHGINRTLTTPYQFVKDGAEIMRKIYYSEGVEGKCTFEIWILNDADWTYSLFFSGPIDFSKLADTTISTTANILDNGVESKLKANETTPYEIDCNVADVPSVRLNGITLFGKYKFLSIANGVTTQGLAYGTTPVVEGDFPVVVEGSQKNLSVPLALTLIGSFWDVSRYNEGQFLIAPKQDIKAIVDFKQSFRITAIDDCRLTVVVIIIQPDRMVRDSYILYRENFTGSGGGSGTVYNRNNVGPTSFPMPGYVDVFKGERVCVAYLLSPTSGGGGTAFTLEYFGNDDFTISEGTNWITVNIQFKLAETFCPAIPYFDLFDKLMKKVLETTSTVSYSSMLRSSTAIEDNIAYYNQVTCGDAIRGFATAKIRTNLSECFQDLTSRHCAGLGIDNLGRVIVEPLSTFYQKDLIIANLGEVSEMKISPAIEYMGNQVNIGQENQEYDKLNGRYEYNQQASFKLPISRVTETLDLVSKWRVDMYGIETFRANLTQKKTTDSKSDNDTFVLSTDSDTIAHNKLRRPNLSGGGSVTGVPDPVGAYNIDLTPKRNLLRNKSRLAAIAHLRNSEKVTFLTIDKNESLQAKFNSSRPLIIEKADVLVSDLGSPLFIPIQFEFTAIVPRNLMALMATSRYGCFQFKYKGNTYKGFPLDVGIKPSNNDKYEFVLLSTPDNDISKLY